MYANLLYLFSMTFPNLHILFLNLSFYSLGVKQSMNKAKKTATTNAWCNCGQTAASTIDYSEGRAPEEIPKDDKQIKKS